MGMSGGGDWGFCRGRGSQAFSRTLGLRLWETHPPRVQSPRPPELLGMASSATPSYTHLLLHLDDPSHHADFIHHLRVGGPLVALLPGLPVPGPPTHNLVHPMGKGTIRGPGHTPPLPSTRILGCLMKEKSRRRGEGGGGTGNLREGPLPCQMEAELGVEGPVPALGVLHWSSKGTTHKPDK